jgi:hypothetical protein
MANYFQLKKDCFEFNDSLQVGIVPSSEESTNIGSDIQVKVNEPLFCHGTNPWPQLANPE